MSRFPKRIFPVTRNPGIKSFIRLKQRISVLFPQPEGPMMAVISCFRTPSEMFFKICASPYQALMFWVLKVKSFWLSAVFIGISQLIFFGSDCAGRLPQHSGSGLDRKSVVWGKRVDL